jgi:hypothetical protein
VGSGATALSVLFPPLPEEEGSGESARAWARVSVTDPRSGAVLDSRSYLAASTAAAADAFPSHYAACLPTLAAASPSEAASPACYGVELVNFWPGTHKVLLDGREASSHDVEAPFPRRDDTVGGDGDGAARGGNRSGSGAVHHYPYAALAADEEVEKAGPRAWWRRRSPSSR